MISTVRDGNRSFLRFLALYAVLVTVIYAVIPYKTPWCALTSLHGMIPMAGVVAGEVLRRIPTVWAKAAVVVALGLGVVHLGQQAYRASFVYAADARNPYVYAHSSYDVVELARRVEDIASLHPDGPAMLVKVIAEEYWPLPWYSMLSRTKKTAPAYSKA